jgi:hypothetical protein
MRTKGLLSTTWYSPDVSLAQASLTRAHIRKEGELESDGLRRISRRVRLPDLWSIASEKGEIHSEHGKPMSCSEMYRPETII